MRRSSPGLFEYLHASKRSVTGGDADLVAGADVVLTERSRGRRPPAPRPLRPGRGVDLALRRARPVGGPPGHGIHPPGRLRVDGQPRHARTTAAPGRRPYRRVADRDLCRRGHARRDPRRSGPPRRRGHARLHGGHARHLPVGLRQLRRLAASSDRHRPHGRGALGRADERRVRRLHDEQRPAIPGLRRPHRPTRLARRRRTGPGAGALGPPPGIPRCRARVDPGPPLRVRPGGGGCLPNPCGPRPGRVEGGRLRAIRRTGGLRALGQWAVPSAARAVSDRGGGGAAGRDGRRTGCRRRRGGVATSCPRRRRGGGRRRRRAATPEDDRCPAVGCSTARPGGRARRPPTSWLRSGPTW